MQPSEPGTFRVFVRRYAPFASFGGGFEGDGRGFSADPAATARTVGVVTIGRHRRLSATGYATGSAWVGPWQARRHLPGPGIEQHVGQVRTNLSAVSSTERSIRFTLHTEGNLPLKDVLLRKKGSGWLDAAADGLDHLSSRWRPRAPRPQGTPDIDTYLDLRIDFAADAATFTGSLRGDSFPNAEVFVLDGRGTAAGLLDYRTGSGILSPYYRLFGDGAGNRLATFTRRVPLHTDRSFLFGSAGRAVVVAEE